MGIIRIVIRLAFADLWAERVLGFCSIVSLAAVLAPLIVLAGLRAGVVEGLRQLLLDDPHAREIVTAENRTFETALLTRLAARPDVAFVAPRTRTLSASLVLQQPDGLPTARVELLPSAAGDPLISRAPTRASDIVLSTAAAARLQAVAGTMLTGRLGRTKGGQRQSVLLNLHVIDIAPPAAFARDAAFVTLDLALLLENYQDGIGEAPATLDHFAAPPRADYAGFRLYTNRIEQVPAVDAALRAEGIEIVSRAGDVANLLTVDRSLGTLFLMIAGLGGSGFLVSLGAGLWANVERKRVPLALLRFLGLRRLGLSIFPVVQAGALAACGAALGLAAALAASLVVNVALADTLALNRPLCVISPLTALAAIGVTCLGAFAVATAAALRAGHLEPWEGVST